MNWSEWIDYLTKPHADQLIWVIIGVPVVVLLLNYLVPQIMEWRAYRKTHPWAIRARPPAPRRSVKRRDKRSCSLLKRFRVTFQTLTRTAAARRTISAGGCCCIREAEEKSAQQSSPADAALQLPAGELYCFMGTRSGITS